METTKKLAVKASAQSRASSIDRLAICGCSACRAPSQGVLIPSRLKLADSTQAALAASHRPL